jgi:hypothetical protein
MCIRHTRKRRGHRRRQSRDRALPGLVSCLTVKPVEVEAQLARVADSHATMAPKCVADHIRLASSPWMSSASNARVEIGPEATVATDWWRGSGPTSPCPICSSPCRHASADETSRRHAARASPTWPFGADLQSTPPRSAAFLMTSAGHFSWSGWHSLALCPGEGAESHCGRSAGEGPTKSATKGVSKAAPSGRKAAQARTRRPTHVRAAPTVMHQPHVRQSSCPDRHRCP